MIVNLQRLKYILILFFVFSQSFSQSKLDAFLTPSDTLNIARRNLVVISEASIATVSLVGLHQLWYADYPKSKFHTVNDSNEWLQMDKMGHVFSAYQMGRLGANTLNWSGVDKKDQLLYGATLGFGFLTAVEVFDGFSKEWGFSWGDILANATGTGLYIGQELLWNEQRITLKFSFHQTAFAPQNPEKLGDGFLEEILKDYNGQTYWLNFNLHSFFRGNNLPEWLDLSLGYSGQGMIGSSQVIDNQLLKTNESFRQYYLSFDINLSKIKVKNSRFLTSLFDVLNVIKVPFPTLEFSKNGCVFHLLYY